MGDWDGVEIPFYHTAQWHKLKWESRLIIMEESIELKVITWLTKEYGWLVKLT